MKSTILISIFLSSFLGVQAQSNEPDKTSKKSQNLEIGSRVLIQEKDKSITPATIINKVSSKMYFVKEYGVSRYGTVHRKFIQLANDHSDFDSERTSSKNEHPKQVAAVVADGSQED